MARKRHGTKQDKPVEHQVARGGKQTEGAPRTTETGARNSGGQTARVTDKPRREKQSGGR